MTAASSEEMDTKGVPRSVRSSGVGAFAVPDNGSGKRPSVKVEASSWELGCKPTAPLPGRNRGDTIDMSCAATSFSAIPHIAKVDSVSKVVRRV